MQYDNKYKAHNHHNENKDQILREKCTETTQWRISSSFPLGIRSEIAELPRKTGSSERTPQTPKEGRRKYQCTLESTNMTAMHLNPESLILGGLATVYMALVIS
jgi:hypothetical protein